MILRAKTYRTPAIACGIVAGLTCALASCRTPTQSTIEIVSELAHRPDMAVSVQLGAGADVEGAPPRVVTRTAWPADGSVGTVVAVPSGDEDGGFVVRVVLAAGRDPSTCSATDAKGCVVVRRRSRFAPDEATRLRVVLRPVCLGVFCDATTSCARDGACGSLESDAESDAGPDAGADGASPASDDPYAKVVIADRPRHYYRFDDPPGSPVARDVMGRANGTYEGALGRDATGALATSTNPGISFDGRGGSVVVPALEDLPNASSFEAWIRYDGPATDPEPTVFERLDRVGTSTFGYRLSKPPQSVAAFSIFRGDLTLRASAQPLRFAGYMHVVAVTRGGSVELFLDGTAAVKEPFADAPPAPVLAPFVVGASRTGGTPWRGNVDELAIYDYPLSREQIRAHYDAAGEKTEP